MYKRILTVLFVLGFAVASSAALAKEDGAHQTSWLSHAPMRPLPAAFNRPMADGPAKFVDAAKGDDKQPGTQEAPWKTLAFSLKQLKPGDTLYLRGGTYYETVTCGLAGEKSAPITIRAFPNELVILDGGYREFYENPAKAWEPFPNGAPDEYRSTREYKDLGKAGAPRHGVYVLGNFGDSMVPLHGYFTILDLRTDNRFANLDNSMTGAAGMYCGPGLWYDTRFLGTHNYGTARIHIRLKHTDFPVPAGMNYAGETDPRKVPLIIGGPNPVLALAGAKNVRIQDLTLRGTRDSTLEISDSQSVEADGLTVYGGAPALLIRSSSDVRILNSTFRGVSSPWITRYAEKYRGVATYLIEADDRAESDGVEFASCEFSDSHDGLFLHGLKSLSFHHNLVENFNDDGLEVGVKRHNGQMFIYQNRIVRTLLTFSLHGGKGVPPPIESDPGSGVYIFRNVIDLRPTIRKSPARAAGGAEEAGQLSVLCTDHGSPIWPNYYFYQNTVLRGPAPWRAHYAFGFGANGTNGNERGVFNNIFVTMDGLPGMTIAAGEGYQMDGNLSWGVKDGPKQTGDFFAKFRKSKLFEESKKWYAPGWTANDLFGNPNFSALNPDWHVPSDLTLQKDSPAVNAGVKIPKAWPDTLRDQDSGQRDIGALPLGVKPWGVGVRGRFSLFAETAE